MIYDIRKIWRKRIGDININSIVLHEKDYKKYLSNYSNKYIKLQVTMYSKVLFANKKEYFLRLLVKRNLNVLHALCKPIRSFGMRR